MSQQISMAERLLLAKGRMFMAAKETLEDIIATNAIEVDKSKPMDRVEAVTVIEAWLEEELGKKDGGAVALLSIETILQETGIKQEKDTQHQLSQSGTDSLPSSDKHVKTVITKDFKIHGQVDSKCGISYVSLMRQVDLGEKRKIPEIDIMDAVIRAIPPTSGLRNYLEGRPDLDLTSLRAVVRAHYKEKTATELYNELGNATQEQKEDPTDFLMRTLDLRQKILFASKDSKIQYDPSLVTGLFLRTLCTGLQDDNIRQEFRPMLEKDGVTDEELIEGLNSIVSRENERKSKVGRQSKRVNAVTADPQVLPEMKELKTEKEKPREGILFAEVRSLKAEVAELKDILVKQRTESSSADRPRQPPQLRRGCHVCHEAGVGDSCNHCWRCGSSEHFKKGCRAWRGRNTPRQENERGSLRGDGM